MGPRKYSTGSMSVPKREPHDSHDDHGFLFSQRKTSYPTGDMEYGAPESNQKIQINQPASAYPPVGSFSFPFPFNSGFSNQSRTHESGPGNHSLPHQYPSNGSNPPSHQPESLHSSNGSLNHSGNGLPLKSSAPSMHSYPPRHTVSQGCDAYSHR